MVTTLNQVIIGFTGYQKGNHLTYYSSATHELLMNN